jgi:hypothetical protein
VTEPEKESDINASSSRESDSCDSGACDASGYGFSFGSFLEKNPLILGSCLILLTIGAILCMVLFIYLAFQKPDAANIVIPLLLLPVGGIVAKYGGRAINGYKSRPDQGKDKS